MGRIGATLDPFEKLTVLLFDEMKVQELYEYDVKRDEVIKMQHYTRMVNKMIKEIIKFSI